MNTRHTDRLMSRASVAVMAAFAPKPEGQPGLPQFAERVDAEPAGGDAGGDDMGLSAEEQAQFDAMQRGEGGSEPSGDRDPGGAEVDDGGEGEDDDAGDDGVDDAGGERGEDPGDAGTERAAQEPEQPAKKRKTVSFSRYERERTENARKLKEAQDALAAAQERTARLDERTRLLTEAINAPRPQATAPTTPAADPDPEPNADEDPIGHSAWKIRKLEATVQELSTGRKQDQDRQTAQGEEERLAQAYLGDLEMAAREDSAYGDAFVHLRESRYAELGQMFAGIDINDPAQCATLSPQDRQRLAGAIQSAFNNEQRMLTEQALKSNRRPSAIVMSLAKARGFQKVAAAPAAAPAPAAPARNGAQAPAARPSVSEEVAAIRNGASAARSLSDAGGSPGGGIDLSRLADMSDEEFEAAYSQIRNDPRQSAAFDRANGKIPM